MKSGPILADKYGFTVQVVVYSILAVSLFLFFILFLFFLLKYAAAEFVVDQFDMSTHIPLHCFSALFLF